MRFAVSHLLFQLFDPVVLFRQGSLELRHLLRVSSLHALDAVGQILSLFEQLHIDVFHLCELILYGLELLLGYLCFSWRCRDGCFVFSIRSEFVFGVDPHERFECRRRWSFRFVCY